MPRSSETSSGGGQDRIRRAPRKRSVQNIEALVNEAEAKSSGGSVVTRSLSSVGRSTSLALGVRESDIAAFLRQLIMLLDAGTPLLKSLKTLADRSDRAGVRALVSDIAQYVEMGNPLWQAFERHPRYFDAVFVNLIKASEASGTLTTVLERVTRYRERRIMLRRKVQAAMVYPLIVFLACFGVILIIGKFVMPEFRNIFATLDMADKIPPFTLRFMAVVDVITNGTVILTTVIVLVVLLVLYKLITRDPRYRLRADRLKLMIPYIGPKIIRKNAIVDMTRTLALLLSSGLSMMVTLDLTRNAIRNRAVGQTIQDLRDAVERGEGIEAPLRRVPRLIPPVVTDMLVTGEESGQLDKIANQVADTLEEEVNIHINTLSDLLPPVLALIMGAFVLMLALAVFVPLIGMVEQLQQGGGGGA